MFLDITVKENEIIYLSLTNILYSEVLYAYPKTGSNLNLKSFSEIEYKRSEQNQMSIFLIYLFGESGKHRQINILAQKETLSYVLKYLKDKKTSIVNLSNFESENIRFKDIEQFSELPCPQIANRIGKNPCLSKIPTIIKDNWWKNDLYSFHKDDFSLMDLIGNSQSDCQKYQQSLDNVSVYVDRKTFYGKIKLLYIYIHQVCSFNPIMLRGGERYGPSNIKAQSDTLGVKIQR